MKHKYIYIITFYIFTFKTVLPKIISYKYCYVQQDRMDIEYLNMIKQTFNTPYYYFSYTYDLTHTMQRLYNTSSSFVNVSLKNIQ